jgi:acyl carrier protein
MSTLAQIQDLIQSKFDVAPSALDPQASLREQNIDSLTLVEFLFAVEDHFKISMPEKYSDVDTLVALAAAVDEVRASATV